MYIRSITLRDWKAFQSAQFEFPAPTPRKNVVLIGALNGYGKTSLLEALVLGLFGRDGLGVLARAMVQDGENERLAASYDDFLQRALHAKALEQGRTSASVEIVLADEDDTVTIQRIWNFSGAGKHQRDDEEVRIWRGPDRELVRIPKMEDREDFIRSFVAQQFLPVGLSQFFLFDGEQVQRLAKRDMSAQVRLGIEGILGVPILRELEQDLANYAQSRRNGVPRVNDETIERTRAEVRELEARVREADEELARLAPQLEPLKTRRNQLVKDLSSLAGGSYANLRELHETQGRLERERDKLKDRLDLLLKEELALAIAGHELRSQTVTRLVAEHARAKWENGKQQSDTGLVKLMGALDASGPPITPALVPEQIEGIREWVRRAWEAAWHPPPPECADGFRHMFLGATERALVQNRLERVGQIALGSIRDLLDQYNEIDTDLRKVMSRISLQQGVDEKSRAMHAELEKLNTQVGELERRVGELNRSLEGDRGTLNPAKQKLAAMLEGHQRAQPQLMKAAFADRIAEMIEDVIKESYPLHINTVADEMTKAYRQMAHKALLKAVKIEPDCTVRLLGDGGRDMREMDASAGENQLFALSLIAAIAKVSERHFPIVMDTPLARLDPAHRFNVLKFFTGRVGEQVVLLSQPGEVHGQYLDAIRERVCVAYKVEHEELSDGVGISRVAKGYFEEV
jgi:DNA sulfur modification protein DndD